MIGVWTNSSTNPLTREQQQQNAREIYSYFYNHGWTLNAIAGMLGNMEVESYINPAQWESAYPIYGSGGFGLVQWTPWTKYSDWAGPGWESAYGRQLERIQYELENDLQWIPVASDGYMSFQNFTQSELSAPDLAMIFERGYERGTPLESVRRANAEYWFDYLGGVSPSRGLPVWMLFELKRRYINNGYSGALSRY